jgi:hypothetical protein
MAEGMFGWVMDEEKGGIASRDSSTTNEDSQSDGGRFQTSQVLAYPTLTGEGVRVSDAISPSKKSPEVRDAKPENCFRESRKDCTTLARKSCPKSRATIRCESSDPRNSRAPRCYFTKRGSASANASEIRKALMSSNLTETTLIRYGCRAGSSMSSISKTILDNSAG